MSSPSNPIPEESQPEESSYDLDNLVKSKVKISVFSFGSIIVAIATAMYFVLSVYFDLRSSMSALEVKANASIEESLKKGGTSPSNITLCDSLLHEIRKYANVIDLKDQE